MLPNYFFDQDACLLAQSLLGKVLCVKQESTWLYAKIIETEAYYLHDKASHSSLGFTEKRKALFMPPGTLYMYYARGGDSLNISAEGEGNAVLIKSAYPYEAGENFSHMVEIMQRLNPHPTSHRVRSISKLCRGQTLLCKSLGLKVKDWSQKEFVLNQFFIKDVNYHPEKIIQCKRLGIPEGRDEHFLYRFIDFSFREYCVSNPLKKRNAKIGEDYLIFNNKEVKS